jgi:DNA-binding response OmpR family regulator
MSLKIISVNLIIAAIIMSNDEKQILIVEDQKIIALDLKMMLERWGYNVLGIFGSGTDAIDFVSSHKPDLILMDIMLNGKLNGIETAERITKTLDVSIIYLTALTDISTYINTLKTKPKKYLMKPIDSQSLESAIKEVFAV